MSKGLEKETQGPFGLESVVVKQGLFIEIKAKLQAGQAAIQTQPPGWTSQLVKNKTSKTNSSFKRCGSYGKGSIGP
jgi:hypothetical protein